LHLALPTEAASVDRETVIESIVEIAERGSYSCFAVEQLESELSRCGYELADRRTIVEVSLQAGAEHDPRKFASALYEVLEST
jgi:hypothetical protein